MYDIQKLFPKVAIVADQMLAFGGADREMFSILKLLPNADIFTIAYDPSKYPTLQNTVKTSFVQKLLKFLPKSFFRHLKIFTPFAYESFNLEGYNLVLSISAGPAKGIVTGIDQPHLAMVMTPPRSLWDKELNVRASRLKSMYKSLSYILNTYLRIWDWTISKRVDYWSSNSKFIARKILKRYGQEAKVIYPGVESKYFKKSSSKKKLEVRNKYQLPKKFFLVTSRLYDYKNVDVAIRAIKNTKENLVIIGDGPDRKYLEKEVGESKQVKFLGFVEDDLDVKTMYEISEALIFCGIEDFGLVPVEAMASGTPVLGFAEGGLLETVSKGISGEFFQTEEELTSLLINFDKRRYNKEEVIKQAQLFSEEKFLHNLTEYLEYIYEEESKKREEYIKSCSCL